MPQNGINPPGVKALSEAFMKNPNLRVINLEDNTLRPDGAGMLAGTIPTLQFLEELNLGDCLLKGSGTKSIMDAIQGHKTLKAVYMASNEIPKQAGLHAASILRKLPNLTTVNLSENEFGDTAVEEIGRLLPNVNVIIE
jgi:Ran GTPase-activating protein 1